ncbi:MAG: S1 RNA-binding domain-containing protein [Acidobacteriia bacterium]|nr:S1 RNA-binding domain-containing protein [Terriglobia bacterium]
MPRDDERPDPNPPLGDEDFASMLEDTLKPRSFEEGQTVEGVVVAVTDDVAFIDIGGKGEATIDLGELKGDDGELEVEIGDRIAALVVSTEGGLKLSRRLARGAALRQQLADAFRAGLPVEGKVDRAIKGGYEVKIAGQRAFCPISQMDTAFTADPSVHEGKVYTFRIVEYREGGKNLVVSRRALLEEEEREKADEVRLSAVPGAVLRGRIVSVREYGAFVDLGGGVQGLLHVSEMGWSRVSNPADVVAPGDEITVKVLRVDDAKKQIALGLKQLGADPWTTVDERYAAGQVSEGRVTRIATFGAFVELEPGIEALAHVSTFPPTGTADGWKASVPPGTLGAFEILSVDVDRKRIGVAMLEAGSSRAAEAKPKPEIVAGARIKGKVERLEKFGVFVFLAPGRTGLIPLGETGVEKEADLRRAFPVGGEVEVAVVEVDAATRRIRLSRRAVLEAEEKSEAKEYADRQEGPQGEAFGASLADKLRAALGK